MDNLVVWALLNGLVTGAVWIGIVLLRRQRREVVALLDHLAEVRRGVEDSEYLADRIAQLEERLDVTERLLATGREQERVPPARRAGQTRLDNQ